MMSPDFFGYVCINLLDELFVSSYSRQRTDLDAVIDRDMLDQVLGALSHHSVDL